jgi:hypothetical protein
VRQIINIIMISGYSISLELTVGLYAAFLFHSPFFARSAKRKLEALVHATDGFRLCRERGNNCIAHAPVVLPLMVCV